MMTMTLRIALILVAFATCFLIMRKIRQSKMQIENAIFWIVLSIVLVIYSIFPQVADFCAHLLGIYATTNFLFLFAIFVLIVKVFYMTIHISQLESRIRELVQKMALEEKKREEAEAAVRQMGAELQAELQTDMQAGRQTELQTYMRTAAQAAPQEELHADSHMEGQAR